MSKEFQKINADALRKDLLGIVALSQETRPAAAAGGPAAPGDAAKPAGGKTPNLDQYTVDLTGNAKKGKIDPVLGRDPEIRQVIDILTRRRQNNPILTGEAGVGKTAVVEGFALRVAQGDVPPPLKNVHMRTLDLALLQAGAGVKGEFENRLKGLIEEVKASPTPIILFIDEAHTMIGAGGQAGQNDAANLLKPALARGELRTIAATTWSEYKKYFEKDAALARRFQVVKVEEPSEHAVHDHDARPGGIAREASQRPHSRRSGFRQRPALASLSRRTAAAGQGGQHSRHRVRAPGAGTEHHAAGDRRPRPARSTRSKCRRASSIAKRSWAPTTRRSWPRSRRRRKSAEEKLKALQDRWDKERDLVGKIRELRGKLEGTQDGKAAPAAARSGAKRRRRRGAGRRQPLPKRPSRSCRPSRPSSPRCRARPA